jgi:pyruvate-formate lyase-activating enzyme
VEESQQPGKGSPNYYADDDVVVLNDEVGDDRVDAIVLSGGEVIAQLDSNVST